MTDEKGWKLPVSTPSKLSCPCWEHELWWIWMIAHPNTMVWLLKPNHIAVKTCTHNSVIKSVDGCFIQKCLPQMQWTDWNLLILSLLQQKLNKVEFNLDEVQNAKFTLRRIHTENKVEGRIMPINQFVVRAADETEDKRKRHSSQTSDPPLGCVWFCLLDSYLVVSKASGCESK